jgi:uncharacterized protein YkwD
MKRRLVALAVALSSLFGAPGPLSFARTAHASVDVGAAEMQLIDLLNADRAAHGLQPLTPDPRLMEVARWRSEDMVSRNFFSHDLGGFNVGRLLREREIHFNLAGENIVSNTFDDAATVAAAQVELMKSTDHRQNVLGADYNAVGVGVAVGPNRRTVYTQIFVQT